LTTEERQFTAKEFVSYPTNCSQGKKKCHTIPINLNCLTTLPRLRSASRNERGGHPSLQENPPLALKCSLKPLDPPLSNLDPHKASPCTKRFPSESSTQRRKMPIRCSNHRPIEVQSAPTRKCDLYYRGRCSKRAFFCFLGKCSTESCYTKPAPFLQRRIIPLPVAGDSHRVDLKPSQWVHNRLYVELARINHKKKGINCTHKLEKLSTII